ncbi:hypothetical protein FRX31_032470, partial [Thalictrum thalictroides]
EATRDVQAKLPLLFGLVRFFLRVGLEVGGIVRKVETEFSQAYFFFGVGELLLHFSSSCGSQHMFCVPLVVVIVLL